jgi:hypothetical protein
LATIGPINKHLTQIKMTSNGVIFEVAFINKEHWEKSASYKGIMGEATNDLINRRKNGDICSFIIVVYEWGVQLSDSDIKELIIAKVRNQFKNSPEIVNNYTVRVRTNAKGMIWAYHSHRVPALWLASNPIIKPYSSRVVVTPLLTTVNGTKLSRYFFCVHPKQQHGLPSTSCIANYCCAPTATAPHATFHLCMHHEQTKVQTTSKNWQKNEQHLRTTVVLDIGRRNRQTACAEGVRAHHFLCVVVYPRLTCHL